MVVGAGHQRDEVTDLDGMRGVVFVPLPEPDAATRDAERLRRLDLATAVRGTITANVAEVAAPLNLRGPSVVHEPAVDVHSTLALDDILYRCQQQVPFMALRRRQLQVETQSMECS